MKHVFTTLTLASLAGTALADDAAVLRCRAITDSVARLVCYDAMPLEAVPTPAPRFAPPPLPPAAAPTPVPASPSAQFGMEQQQAARNQVDAVESRIDGTFEGWNAKSMLTLANGQVWQIADGSRGVLDLVNPKVTVRRGFMGSFYMEFEGSNLTPRVRRVR